MTQWQCGASWCFMQYLHNVSGQQRSSSTCCAFEKASLERRDGQLEPWMWHRNRQNFTAFCLKFYHFLHQIIRKDWNRMTQILSACFCLWGSLGCIGCMLNCSQARNHASLQECKRLGPKLLTQHSSKTFTNSDLSTSTDSPYQGGKPFPRIGRLRAAAK